ncbi:MAG: hypothetical protein IJZ82_03900 [Lachnospiraceae bacterium]|nr:hypothetical protein [Lachnospiraceae bacterium]
MNLAPIYELRSRLKTAMIAGTGLLAEDFRLKRAAQEIEPLKTLSPVFAKIGQLVELLLSENCGDKEGTLLDALTLVDALLCTQGQLTVEGEIEPLAGGSWGSVITNAPYSQVKGLVEALTTSGEGHYSFVLESHKERPELFSDYRVKSAMVRALGASYSELAEQVCKWLKEEGEEIVPLLQKGFDPKGKKEMVRRVLVMGAVAGDKCNDFYVKMIPEAEKDVKNELIYALRHSQKNVELLLELVKKEKGNAKKMAYYALAEMEDERAEKLFTEVYAKKPADCMSYLSMTTRSWASKLVGEKLVEQLALCRESGYGSGDMVYTVEQTETLRMTLEALPGKSGDAICRAFETAYGVKDIYYKTNKDDKILSFAMHVPGRRQGYRMETRNFAGAVAYFLEAAIRMGGDEQLYALADSLYERKSQNNRGVHYFPAAFVARLLGKEDVSEWLQKQLFVKQLFGRKKNEALCKYLANALKGLVYEESSQTYLLRTMVRDDANEEISNCEKTITQNISGDFMDVLLEYSEMEIDKEIIHFVNPQNQLLCSKLEEYFYKKARTTLVENRRIYWEGLVKCRSEKCEGLLVSYVQKSNNLSAWEVYSRLWELPGSVENFEKEAEEVRRLIVDGRVKVRYFSEETYHQYVENVKEKKRSRP